MKIKCTIGEFAKLVRKCERTTSCFNCALCDFCNTADELTGDGRKVELLIDEIVTEPEDVCAEWSEDGCCTACGHFFPADPFTPSPFCPHCGRAMRNGAEQPEDCQI